MPKSEKAVQLLFSVAVAALAAALGDLFVESLSNHGVFGPGRFTDGSNADIIPVGIVGSALFLGCLLLCVRHAFARRPRVHCRRDVTALAPVMSARTLPMTLFLQIVFLWAMETAEQYVVIGHGLGGTIWLGGPAVASLLLHASICLIVTIATRCLLSVLEPRAVRLIRGLLASTAFPFEAAVVVARRVNPSSVLRRWLLVEIAKRGPPAALYCV